MTKTIMIQGTMSNVGKSILTTAFCRIFRQDGYNVAPFKAQNFSSNSFMTKEGQEISQAQATQAEAARVEPDARMNPILIKPISDYESQVIVHGKSWGSITAQNYLTIKSKLKSEIIKSYNSLKDEFDVIVLEGAGSIVELNLLENDIANMGMAKIARAPVLLMGDIERGGVFAQLYGSLKLLPKNESDFIKAIIINKFHGSKDLFGNGIGILERICEKPVAGIIPYLDIDIDDEDVFGKQMPYIKNKLDMHSAMNFRHRNYDLLALSVRNSLDIELIYRIIELGV